jgi:hypothetical protein
VSLSLFSLASCGKEAVPSATPSPAGERATPNPPQVSSESDQSISSDWAEIRGNGGASVDPIYTAASANYTSGHEKMIAILKEIAERIDDENAYIGEVQLRAARKALEELPDDASPNERWQLRWRIGNEELIMGNTEEAIRQMKIAYDWIPRLRGTLPSWQINDSIFEYGVTWMRLGEIQNCVAHCNSESCIVPIRGGGIHRNPHGSSQAIRYFGEVLKQAPDHIQSRWLLNIAYMTIGGYPDDVPSEFALPALTFQSDVNFPRFSNVASEVGLDTLSHSGGAIVDDFDLDGLLDVIVSNWDPRANVRFFKNSGDGTFVEQTKEAGLTGILGGLNMTHADYNNDGNMDFLVLRGSWLGNSGRHPNSLIRNNGDGTFTDVTFEAGLGERFYPTHCGAWADFDLDGDLDLYVGNEQKEGVVAPGQLFRNNGNETFTDVADETGVENHRYGKMAAWGDYDNDRYPDLYVSNYGNDNRLYRNNGDSTFTDVAPTLGVSGPEISFTSWFWDFNNDGALDLFVSSYTGGVSAVAASYAYGLVIPGAERLCLYRGDGKGGFKEEAADRGLRRIPLVMGANFGDLDNDGYPDFYVGTGDPRFETLTPNAMYHNIMGDKFADVSAAGGFGHLQKGHGIAFADMDNDGDQDVFEQMGGAYRADAFRDALFENPGFGNHWIKIRLIGVDSNRFGLGARIRARIAEQGRTREVYKFVNAGGNFGANPISRQEIGLGSAEVIEELEIFWPTTGQNQLFHDVAVDQYIAVTEGERVFEVIPLKEFKIDSS